jgi:hypothetical protein
MTIKISDLKPKKSLVTVLSDNDAKRICGGGSIGADVASVPGFGTSNSTKVLLDDTATVVD